MEVTYVAAALLSALLHASWNAAVKASRDSARAMTAQMLMSAAFVLPGLVWSGLPDRAAWIWIAASTLMNVVTVSALLRAYELGGFGIVYPVSRAVAVLLVVPMATVFAGDRVGPAALCGILIIIASLGALAYDAARGGRQLPRARLDARCRSRHGGLHPVRCAGRARGGVAVGLWFCRLDHECRGNVLAAAPCRRAVETDA
jgi:multidrug transporter EmrE-like cation transporter